MAWTLVPDNPYDDTAARRGPWSTVRRATAWSPRGTKSLVSIWAISSGSRVKCRLRGTTPCCTARTAFISPSAPAADWVCPKLVFTDASAHGPSTAVHLGEACVFDGVTDGGTGAVRLHHADGAGVHARRSQCRAIGRDLRGPGRRHDIHRVAVLVGGRAAHHGQDPVAVGHCASGSRLSSTHHATLAGHETVRVGVERMAVSGRRQHADGGRRRGPCGVPTSRGAAGQRNVAFAVVQAAAGQMDRCQARRARGIHRDRGTVQPHARRRCARTPCTKCCPGIRTARPRRRRRRARIGSRRALIRRTRRSVRRSWPRESGRRAPWPPTRFPAAGGAVDPSRSLLFR